MLKQIWKLQWATPRGITEMDRNGTLYYTVDRMEKLLSDCYDAGKKDGELEGRANFRKELEEGNLLSTIELSEMLAKAREFEMKRAYGDD